MLYLLLLIFVMCIVFLILIVCKKTSCPYCKSDDISIVHSIEGDEECEYFLCRCNHCKRTFI